MRLFEYCYHEAVDVLATRNNVDHLPHNAQNQPI